MKILLKNSLQCKEEGFLDIEFQRNEIKEDYHIYRM